MQQNEFQQIPATFWIYLLLPFSVIAVTLIGIKTHNPFMFGLIGVIPFAVLLVNRIDLWLVTIFAVYNSNLRIPGLLGELELFHILIAGLVGVVFLRTIIQKELTPRRGWMWRFIYLFVAVLAVTIAARGTGFRFLGDSRWGGMRYVEVFLTMLFVFVVLQLRLTPRQWRVAIIAMSVLALLPTLADIVFILSDGAVYFHYYLIKHGAVGEALQASWSGGVTRFKSAESGGMALLILPFVLFPPTARHLWKYVLLVVGGIALLSITGFRLGIIRAAAFVWIYFFLVLRGHRVKLLVVSVLLAAAGLVLLFLLMPYLPLSVQRAFSFIPFLNVDPLVEMSAVGTTDWRLQVWKNALSEIPEYWLLGKGYTYDPLVLASFMENRTPMDWARIQVAYHNGLLSLLIGMGVFGLFAGLGVLATTAWRHYRVHMATWHDDTLKRFHGVFFSLLIVSVAVFVSVYGDVYVSFPGIFKSIALLEGLALTNRSLLAADNARAPTPSPARLVPAMPRRVMPVGI